MNIKHWLRNLESNYKQIQKISSIGVAIALLSLFPNKVFAQVGSPVGATSSLQINSSGGGSSPTGGDCGNQAVTAVAAGTAIPTCGTALTVNSLTFDITNHNSVIQYGAGQISGNTPNRRALANQLRLANGTTAQGLSIAGTEGATPDTSYYLNLISPTGPGSYGGIGVSRGDVLDNVNLQLFSDEDGIVTIGNEDTSIFVVGNGNSPISSGQGGTNIRGDYVYGVSNLVSGPTNDPITAGWMYGGTHIMKLSDGNSGYATLDVLGINASGAAGASCALTVVAHLTVVNGIVTVCN